jgi:hypothetical protein
MQKEVILSSQTEHDIPIPGTTTCIIYTTYFKTNIIIFYPELSMTLTLTSNYLKGWVEKLAIPIKDKPILKI